MAKKIEVPAEVLVSHRKSDPSSVPAQFFLNVTVPEEINKNVGPLLARAKKQPGVLVAMRQYYAPIVFFQLEILGSHTDTAAQKRACDLGVKILDKLGFKPKGKIKVKHEEVN